MHTSNKGFTLIELIIAVSIISILAVIAVPSYLKHMQRSHRNDAISALMRIAAEQEKFYFQNSRYGNIGDLGNPVTEHGYYNLFVFGNTTETFTAVAFASPAGPQFDDTHCRFFFMNGAGLRFAMSSTMAQQDDCWR